MDVNTLLSTIAMGLLVLALPIVIAAAFQHFRVMSQQLKMKLSEEQQANIDKAIKVGVQVAEQTGILKNLLGPEKKKEAIAIAQKFLAEKGIKLDLDKMADLIEAEVRTQFAKPTPPADSPEARKALIDSAIRTGIQAAEQSGLTGLIQNLGPEKKAYAAGLALKYLDQYGIQVDSQLLSGLIEGQLMASLQQGRAGQQLGGPAQIPGPQPAYVPVPPPAPASMPAPAPAQVSPVAPTPSVAIARPAQPYPAPAPVAVQPPVPTAPPAGIVMVTPPQPSASVMLPATEPLTVPPAAPAPPPVAEPNEGPAG